VHTKMMVAFARVVHNARAAPTPSTSAVKMSNVEAFICGLVVAAPTVEANRGSDERAMNARSGEAGPHSPESLSMDCLLC
jgi:hypothetical protein